MQRESSDHTDTKTRPILQKQQHKPWFSDMLFQVFKGDTKKKQQQQNTRKHVISGALFFDIFRTIQKAQMQFLIY